jgi:hypothetical protein
MISSRKVLDILRSERARNIVDVFAEFRFTLQRKTAQEPSPYKRVIDLMLRTSESGEAVVDIVEVNSVRVNNPEDPKDLSGVEDWLNRLS